MQREQRSEIWTVAGLLVALISAIFGWFALPDEAKRNLLKPLGLALAQPPAPAKLEREIVYVPSLIVPPTATPAVPPSTPNVAKLEEPERRHKADNNDGPISPSNTSLPMPNSSWGYLEPPKSKPVHPIGDYEVLAQIAGEDAAKLIPMEYNTTKGGSLSAECDVDADGRFSNCKIAADPPGQGLEPLAEGTAKAFRVGPRLKDGAPSAGTRAAFGTLTGPRAKEYLESRAAK